VNNSITRSLVEGWQKAGAPYEIDVLTGLAHHATTSSIRRRSLKA